jgi:flagellar hook-length control protein FliK
VKGGEKMNLALNLLPTTSSSAPVSSSKSSNNSSKSQTKTSFSDTLNNVVSKSDEATVNEQESVTTDNPMDSVVPNNVIKKNDTDTTKEQTSADSTTIPEGDTTKLEENDLLEQEGLTNLTSAALTTQILLAMPVVNTPIVNTPAVNTQSVVSTEQGTIAIDAAAMSQPQMATNVPDGSTLVQPATTSVSKENPVTNNNQSNMTQNVMSNLLQTGQQSPEILSKLSGSITATVSSGATEQGNSAQVPAGMQPQVVQVEAVPNPNTTIVSQAASLQNQAAQIEIAAGPNGAIAAQTTVGLQTQAVKVETTPSANGKTNQQEQPPIEQVAIPTVGTNQQDRTLSSNLGGGDGQKNSLADSSTLRVTQELSTEGTEVTNSPIFAQNLLSTTGIMASAKTTETQSPTTQVADVYQVVDQIVEQTKIITTSQNTEMVMKLKPEHLGELTLKVAIENGVVNASFHSNNPEVRSLIEASLPQLKLELASTGLKVDNVSVYAGLSQFQPNQGQEQNSRQQLMKFTNKKAAGDFIEAIDGEVTGGSTLRIGSQSGVDYRI